MNRLDKLDHSLVTEQLMNILQEEGITVLDAFEKLETMRAVLRKAYERKDRDPV